MVINHVKKPRDTMESNELDRNCNPEEVENTMLCARWLVHQFEEINLDEIAMLFRRTVEDAEVWIEHMVRRGKLSASHLEPIKRREANSIHNILIKYASISDPELRQSILRQMVDITKEAH